MTDIVPESIRMEQRTVLLVDAWPQYITVTDALMARGSHLQKATFDQEADTVTFVAENGTAVYRVRRDLPKQARGWLAELAEGETPGVLRQRARKFRGG